MDSLLFPFAEYFWFYIGFILFVCFMLILDLGVFHRKAHAVSFKEAAAWSVFWISLAMVFNWIFYRYSLNLLQTDPRYAAIPGLDAQKEALRVSMEFLTGFVLEKALAVDNIFIFVLVFSAFKVPPLYQHRVLFLGILGAIFFRAIFIALGAQLMAYHWVIVAFGVFLIFTGIKLLLVKDKPINPEESKIVLFLKRFLPVTTKLEGHHFFVRHGGKWMMTPLFLCLVFLEGTDIIFAVDSVPAIFAVTKEPLIVFTSNILAILGLRSLYFMISGIMDRFIFLKYGLGLVLVFVGLKMTWLNQIYGGQFPIGLSLGIIAGLIGGSIVLSLIVTRKSAKKKR